MSYHQFLTEDGESYGSFEVFYVKNGTLMADSTGENNEYTEGWYWQACFPGCLPDGEPIGPFDIEQDAIDDGREYGPLS